MRQILMILTAACSLAACQTNNTMETSVSRTYGYTYPDRGTGAYYSAKKQGEKSLIEGKYQNLDPKLVKRLRRMSAHFGKPVTVTSGCRKHGSKRAPRSFHRIAVGCKAADVRIAGVSKYEVARWYAKEFPDGGIGTYCHSNTHVDVRPYRTSWHWGRCKHRRV